MIPFVSGLHMKRTSIRIRSSSVRHLCISKTDFFFLNTISLDLHLISDRILHLKTGD